jgi:hypothetical protein
MLKSSQNRERQGARVSTPVIPGELLGKLVKTPVRYESAKIKPSGAQATNTYGVKSTRITHRGRALLLPDFLFRAPRSLSDPACSGEQLQSRKGS